MMLKPLIGARVVVDLLYDGGIIFPVLVEWRPGAGMSVTACSPLLFFGGLVILLSLFCYLVLT